MEALQRLLTAAVALDVLQPLVHRVHTWHQKALTSEPFGLSRPPRSYRSPWPAARSACSCGSPVLPERRQIQVAGPWSPGAAVEVSGKAPAPPISLRFQRKVEDWSPEQLEEHPPSHAEPS